MQLPTVFRCVALLGTLIGGCKLRVYRNPDKDEIFPQVLDPGNPNLLYTYFELMELIVAHLALWGNAYVRKMRAKELDRSDPRYAPPGSPGEDVIVDLRPINPSRVHVMLDDGDKVFQITRMTKDGRPDMTQKPIILTTFELMHIPGMGYDGLMGLSPIEYAKRTIGTSIAGDRLAARFFVNGSNLGGIIKIKAPLANQTQADEIRRRWLSKHAGVGNAGDVAVLDAEADFQPVTIPPDSLQFLESRGWQTREICRLFGIPPHLVGDVEKSTSWGTGIEQQNIGFVTYTIKGWTDRIAQRFTREVIAVRKQYAEFDLDAMMSGTTQERYAAYSLAIQWGWMSRNDIRAKENMTPGKGLDDYLVPINMATVGSDGKIVIPMNPNMGMGPQPGGGAPGGAPKMPGQQQPKGSPNAATNGNTGASNGRKNGRKNAKKPKKRAFFNPGEQLANHNGLFDERVQYHDYS